MFANRSISRIFPVVLNILIMLSLLIASAAFPGAARAFSNTIQVNTLADNTLVDSQCSLREAVENVNNNNGLTHPECLYGAGNLFIAFATTLGTATITLLSPLPAITHTAGLTIHGGGRITISGNNAYQVFTVNTGVPLTLDSLTVTQGLGSFGGGILNFGTLTLTNSTYSGNSAGTGGGVYNLGGTLTITNSTFSGNNASNAGGGLFNSGTATITGSTFLSNVVTDAFYGGGGIDNFDGTLTVTNSTFGGNSAAVAKGGGLYNFSGTATLTNNTFAFNEAASGGDLYNSSYGTLNLHSTILANSAGGGDCVNYAVTFSGNNNLIEATGIEACGLSNGTNGNIIGSDPSLSSLYAWSGPAYFPLFASSPAVDAGDDAKCAAAPVNNTSQNGLARPQGLHCDIGSYERDTSAPMVLSSVRADADPTSASSVHFTVTFSEPVSGVDTADFSLTTTGSISGAVVTGAIGSGAITTVTVNTGSGDGTLRLNVIDNNSIVDWGSNLLGGSALGDGDFTGGEVYTVNKTVTLTSTGAQDGWILESSETSGLGGTLNSAAATLQLGDDAANKQYRAILSFDTAALPDTAVVSSAVLKIRQSGVPIGSDPFSVLGILRVAIRQGSFGAPALALADFNAAASLATAGSFNAPPVSNWYTAILNAGGRNNVNKTGLTQLRLYFPVDDNNNLVADNMRFLSGNSATGMPTLMITYYVP